MVVWEVIIIWNVPYPRKPHTTCMLPSISRRAKNPPENPVKSQFHAELWEHSVAFTQSLKQTPSGLKHNLNGQRRPFSVCWHVAVRGWCFWEIWRSFLQEAVPDFSLPQRVEKVKEGQGPLQGSQVLFSALDTKILAAIWVLVGGEPSLRAWDSK